MLEVLERARARVRRDARAGAARARRRAFPWHRHERPHPELCDGERSWEALTPSIACAIEGVSASTRLAQPGEACRCHRRRSRPTCVRGRALVGGAHAFDRMRDRGLRRRARASALALARDVRGALPRRRARLAGSSPMRRRAGARGRGRLAQRDPLQPRPRAQAARRPRSGSPTSIERVFSSARTGYEKPHPQAFLHALRSAGRRAAG